MYNGSSIYNSGGSYGIKNAGTLVFSDLIEVENSCFYTLENSGHSEINIFYKENDKQMQADIIQVSSDTAATVYVYKLKDNGLFYPVNYISRSINANTLNNIVITGNTYYVEEINELSPVPAYTLINDEIYKVCKIGADIYLAEDFRGVIGTHATANAQGDPLARYTNCATIQGSMWYNINILNIPNYTDYTDGWKYINNNDNLYSVQCSDLASVGMGGTNSTGFNASAAGIWGIAYYSGAWRLDQHTNTNDYYTVSGPDGNGSLVIPSSLNNTPIHGNAGNDKYMKLRLKKTVY